MLASLTMLFTTSANPNCDCERVGSERLLLGASIEPHVGLRERARQSNPMNGQLFMSREKRKKARAAAVIPEKLRQNSGRMRPPLLSHFRRSCMCSLLRLRSTQ